MDNVVWYEDIMSGYLDRFWSGMGWDAALYVGIPGAGADDFELRHG